MDRNIEKACREQVRFEWEERASAWGGAQYLPGTYSIGEIILENEGREQDPALVAEIDHKVIARFNRACDEYSDWLNKLGPKIF